jgi:competence protein ComEA
MAHPLICAALAAAALLALPAVCVAADQNPAAPQPAASKPDPGAKPGATTKSTMTRKGQAPAATKLVDINTAKRDELKTLPGIDDALAAKIIAGRPYGSKTWLVSKDLLSLEAYDRISKQIIAKQPYKDGAKNAAIYAKKK